MRIGGGAPPGVTRAGPVPERGLEFLRKRIMRFRVYRATWLELKNLSDRDLSDLGLSRDDIPAIAREAARRA